MNDWIWMPHAGHLIVGSDCRFHLFTKVGDVVVSTVGEWVMPESAQRITAASRDADWYQDNHSRKGDAWRAAYQGRFGFEEIGAGRTYETMVFPATPSQHDCCPWCAADYGERDFAGYNDAGEAYRGHMEMCRKWATTGAVVLA